MSNLFNSENVASYDGLYLRDNTPFTISNGIDLDPTHYIKGNSSVSDKKLMKTLMK